MTRKILSIILTLILVLSMSTGAVFSASAAMNNTDTKGVKVDGTIYDVAVGNTLTYTVELEAEKLFEDIQCEVFYDSTKLKLADTTKSTTACPNIANGLIFYTGLENKVTFNSVNIMDGFDFRDEKVLVTLDFEVIDDSYSALSIEFEEMTIMGTGESYFTFGEPVITDGIAYHESLYIPGPVNPATGVAVNGTVYDVQVGETFNYTVELEAEELFEDIQCTVNYDSSKLLLSPDTKAASACPNIATGLVLYTGLKDKVTFNAINIMDGYDFTDEKVLVTLEFTVLDNSYSEINIHFEEMTILGSGESYFTNGEPSVTGGIGIYDYIHYGPIADETGIVVDGSVYDVEVGDTITYTVEVEAEEYFEDIEAIITYDPSILKLADTTKSTTACPNIVNGLVFNTVIPGAVKFNAICLDGYNFTQEKVLVTLEFTVLDDTYSEIDLEIEEMTLLTGDSYFTDGEPSITDGITVTESLKVPNHNLPEFGLNAGEALYDVKEGDVVRYVVELDADKLFEDAQVIVTYDPEKLRLKENTDAKTACPNITSGITFNAGGAGKIKFNAVNVEGYDFTNEKVFLTLEFTVLSNKYSEISLDIIEMTVLGGKESYFEDGKPSVTAGITLTETICIPVGCLGDADGNGKLNVRDATNIQKLVADLEVGEFNADLADIDGNGKVNVKDATAIQKHLADFETGYDIGSDVFKPCAVIPEI